MTLRCTCGDPECVFCGTPQGTYCPICGNRSEDGRTCEACGLPLASCEGEGLERGGQGRTDREVRSAARIVRWCGIILILLAVFDTIWKSIH